MKSTRVCPGCNWEYPWTFHGTRCKFCKTDFAEQFCRHCETWKLSTEFYKRNGTSRTECKNCGRLRKLKFDKDNRQQRYDRDKRFFDARKAELEKRYVDWKIAVSKLPPKILSEQEWLETCSYFGGCAVCGDDHIEARQYFVPFKDGGKYTVHNIYPMCGKCALHAKRVLNPFTWFDKYYGVSGLEVSKEAGERIVAYLQLQIDKAVRENE